MRNARRIGIGCLLEVAMLAAVGFAAPAAARQKLPARRVECGDVVTESLRVANNLLCSGVGLVVGAPDITIDLGGHRIDGGNTASSIGIDNSTGRDDVVIQNGVVSSFENGIVLQNASRNTVTGIRAYGNSGAGIHLLSSSENEIRDNVVSGGGPGIVVEQASDENVLAGNDTSGNFGDGIFIASSAGNVLTGNVAVANIVFGIDVMESPNTILRANVASGNTMGGVVIVAGSNNAVVAKNQASANDIEGIGIFSSSGTLTGNTAHENGVNGIDSDTDGVTLKKNKADGNGFQNGGPGDGMGLGIIAVAGVTSSGNKANGNDDPAQCSSDLECHVP